MRAGDMRLEMRDLELLAALARFEHFTRAAEACGISQPALSARISNIEAQVGMPLVRRGTRFGGFTEEGQILLKWARRILAENDAMLAELTSARGEAAGRISMGVIPTALHFAARLAAAVRAKHPRVVPSIRSASSVEIEAGLSAGRYDVGISYTDEVTGTEHSGGVLRLYGESYVFLAAPRLVDEGREAITWREAASYPLALLTPNMKNRQIIDETFRKVGVRARPVFETDDLSALFAFLGHGGAATIAPANAADPRGLGAGAARLPMVEPELRRTVAALTPDTGFQPPAVAALLRVAAEISGELS
jgi:DNA-binding transcriptional LysR family regulator